LRSKKQKSLNTKVRTHRACDFPHPRYPDDLTGIGLMRVLLLANSFIEHSREGIVVVATMDCGVGGEDWQNCAPG
jgi:hypothetical protein